MAGGGNGEVFGGKGEEEIVSELSLEGVVVDAVEVDDSEEVDGGFVGVVEVDTSLVGDLLSMELDLEREERTVGIVGIFGGMSKRLSEGTEVALGIFGRSTPSRDLAMIS